MALHPKFGLSAGQLALCFESYKSSRSSFHGHYTFSVTFVQVTSDENGFWCPVRKFICIQWVAKMMYRSCLFVTCWSTQLNLFISLVVLLALFWNYHMRLYIDLKQHWYGRAKNPRRQEYRQISNVRSTKFQNLNVSRLVLRLFLRNPFKSGFKSRIWKCSSSNAYLGALCIKGLTVCRKRTQTAAHQIVVRFHGR